MVKEIGTVALEENIMTSIIMRDGIKLGSMVDIIVMGSMEVIVIDIQRKVTIKV